MKWFRDYYMVFVPVLAVLIVCFAIIRTGHSSTIAAPAEYCKAQYTGRTSTEDVPLYTCAAYDANMNCTVPVTNWSTQTHNETRVTCDWLEWR